MAIEAESAKGVARSVAEAEAAANETGEGSAIHTSGTCGEEEQTPLVAGGVSAEPSRGTVESLILSQIEESLQER